MRPQQPVEAVEAHYWLRSQLEIVAFCTRLRRTFELPAFEHDYENENEWCIVATAEETVHVSHAYRYGTYHAWNATCPRGCNYSVAVTSGRQDRWIARLVRLGGGRVHDGRRWHHAHRSG